MMLAELSLRPTIPPQTPSAMLPPRGEVAERLKAAVLKDVSAAARFPAGSRLLAGDSAFPGQVIRPHSGA